MAEPDGVAEFDLLDHHLVEGEHGRQVITDRTVRDRDLQRATVLDGSVPLEDLGERAADLVRQEVGEVTEAAEVDTEHGHVRGRGQAHHTQERAVAAHADGHRRPGEVHGVEVDLDAGLAHPVGPAEAEDAGLVPPLGEPGRGVGGERQRVGAVGMDQEGDDRHRREPAQSARVAGDRRSSASDTAAANRAAASSDGEPRLILAGVQEELDVAGGAGQGGGHHPHDAGFGVVERGRHTHERAQPDRRVAHDALAPGDRGAARFELGLHQEDEVGTGRRDGSGQGGDDAAQRDEGQVGHDQRARLVGGVGPP